MICIVNILAWAPPPGGRGGGDASPRRLKMEGGRPPQIVTLTVKCYFGVIVTKTRPLNQRVALEVRPIRIYKLETHSNWLLSVYYELIDAHCFLEILV